MVANANNASQAASPHSESYGPGVLQMVVDNVLSGSPASVNAKFGPPSTRGEVSLRIIDGKNEDKRNDTGPVGLPIPYGVPMFNPPGVEAQGGTPDFQVIVLSQVFAYIRSHRLFLSFMLKGFVFYFHFL
ncbi:hypothetical protein ANCCAN_27383 [Ancylostoma caninum]|uniref:Uncharacterized protein n=1 Tax=Ancylostoma caninum TaxID=29170 RepID=A0A368F763_ANCCA|nr:hypothetical protein ANCCAN_27383 [Ancylostoma caninum]